MPDWKGRIPLYRNKEESPIADAVGFLVSGIFGCVMLGIGHSYMDSCQNGAAFFLFYGGLMTIIGKILSIIMYCYKGCAERDGVISGLEYCGLGVLTLIKGALFIGDCVVLLWGTIVVFGNYSTWTYEARLHEDTDLTNLDYCDYTPFMFAFVLLILDWIFLPFVFCFEVAKFCNR